VAVWYRAWLRSEIAAGRVDLAELASLHRKVLGVRRASERCYAAVLDEAAMWALAEQARRLERRLAEMKDARRAGARR
jgi:SpoVK/Ycf46/Vps4 family AAA+-type ATPase